MQRRLDSLANARVCVADPRDVRIDIERRVDWFTRRTGDDYAALVRDERRANVVRMAAERRRQAARGDDRLQQRPNVGNESIPAGNQLVELTARRQILILETR